MPFRLIFFYALTICTFILEVCLLTLFSKPIAYPLLSLYIIQLFTNQPRLIFITSALVAKDFILHGILGLPLLYLAPFALIASQIKKRLFYPTTLFHYLFLITGILTQVYLVENLYLGLKTPIHYAIFSIFVSLIVLFIIVKYRFKGEQDNRL